jgi:D-beta-D-heptose 7-phosphate kinase/D-beta-D-heptose 1-phosphate adenosyltransferase
MDKIVLVTGGFDPIHSGHIKYLNEARRLGYKLVVGLNSDEWLERKKGNFFLPYEERKTIVEALSYVDYVIDFDDTDNTACDAIEKILGDTMDTVVFANGGDRNDTTTPEYLKYKNHPDVEFAFGVGGDYKANSSSWILDKWKTNKTERDWGYWRVLDDKQPRIGQKIKELVINPGCSLSDQKHKERSEYWYVLEGTVQIDLEFPDGRWQIQILNSHTDFLIRPNWWHKTTNIGETPAHILEIQYGSLCEENDIVRRKTL